MNILPFEEKIKLKSLLWRIILSFWQFLLYPSCNFFLTWFQVQFIPFGGIYSVTGIALVMHGCYLSIISFWSFPSLGNKWSSIVFECFRHYLVNAVSYFGWQCVLFFSIDELFFFFTRVWIYSGFECTLSVLDCLFCIIFFTGYKYS